MKRSGARAIVVGLAGGTAVSCGGVAFGAAGDGGAASYEGHSLVRVWADDAWEAAQAREAGERLISEGEGPGVMSEWIVDDAGLAALEASGVTFVVVDGDVSDDIEAERRRIARSNDALAAGRVDSWFADYKDGGQIRQRLDELLNDYPGLISEEVVGQSVEGEPIYGFTITSPVGAAGDKPGLLFNGTIHAREWVSPMTVMYIVENLIEDYGSDPRVTRAMDEVSWYIIPVLNPDGYGYSWTDDRYWRKNRRDNGDGSFGVDLNRNFPVGFGGASTSTSGFSDVYHGPAPFSEPESRALRDYILSKPNVEGHIDFHSYSALVLWPTGYQLANTVPEPDLGNMIDLSFMMEQAIFDETGYSYIAQNSADLYPAGGVTSDWAYEEEGVYSWTVELRPESSFGGGFALPADEILDTGRENFAAVLTLADALIDGVRYEFPDGLPSVVDAGADVPIRFSLSSLFAGSVDGATAELLWREGSSGGFSSIDAVKDGSGVFEAVLPGRACDADVEFYLLATGGDGSTFRSPSVSGEVYTVDFAAQSVAVSDSFEAPSGWTVGAPGDTAFTGVWNRGAPQATSSQPGADVTPGAGTDAWVTDFASGGSDGAADVDGGATSLISPVYDLSGVNEAVVGYWRWFSNDAGASPNEDVFRVFVSNDGGASWSVLEEVGPGGVEASGGWFEASIRIDQVLPLSDAVRFKFVAEDAGSGSLVEAAIDDLSITVLETCCPGDADGDGAVDLNDLLAVLGAFGTTSTDGDIDGDGVVDLDDLLSVLSAFGGVCE